MIQDKLIKKERILPSKLVSHEITKFEKEVYQALANILNVTPEVAKSILNDDNELNRLLDTNDKATRLRMQIEVLPKLEQAIVHKTDSGSMAQAKESVVAFGILRDKIMGQDKYSGQLNIGGKNVQVNLSWKPKWLRGKKS